MSKQLKEERGLTLIEVLAATVIGTLLILFIGNALLFGLKQFKNQSEKAQELTGVTIVVKAVTKDIRKATSVEVNDVNLELMIEKKPVTYRFDKENKVILKNGREFFKGIELFTVSRSGDFLNIRIESKDENESPEKINTELYLRN